MLMVTYFRNMQNLLLNIGFRALHHSRTPGCRMYQSMFRMLPSHTSFSSVPCSRC